MKNIIIRNLALGFSLSLPSLALAQGTYLSAPSGGPSQAFVINSDGSAQANYGLQTMGGYMNIRSTAANGEPRIGCFGSGADNAIALGWSTGGFGYIQGGTWGSAPRPLGMQVGGGNVGIGTADSPYKLTIQSGNGIMFRDSAAIYANNTDMRLYTDWNRSFLFSDSAGNELVRITGGGKVAIGTTTPQAKLDVAGDLRAESLYVAVAPRINDGIYARDAEGRFIVLSPSFGQGAYNNIVQPGDQGMVFTRQTMDSQGAFVIAPWSSTLSGLRMTAEGDIGIGKASPDAKLDVVGNGTELGGTVAFSAPSKGPWKTHFQIGATGDSYIRSSSASGKVVLQDTGGYVGIGKDNPQSTLDVNGKVTCTVLELTSDRAQKSGFAPVDCSAILEKVAGLPLSTWHYTNSPSTRHLGTMAQDFMAAFGLGESDTHISVVDALGVSFAAIQGLNDVVKEKDARITALEKEVASLRSDLVARLAALEKQFAQSTPASAPSATGPTVETSVEASSAR